MLLSVVILSVAGLAVCLYGFYVERQLKIDNTYKAACDLSDVASCTKTFLSPWGKLLGVSNIYIGLIFYLVMLVLGIMHMTCWAFLGAVGACIGSLYLAYILYTKVKTFCLICTSLYVINALLLLVTYRCI
jgi:vitamin-K-epoxide reductase (warfarin-sensitive)